MRTAENRTRENIMTLVISSRRPMAGRENDRNREQMRLRERVRERDRRERRDERKKETDIERGRKKKEEINVGSKR